ncbi:MAG: hypothetical protein KC653_00640 [Candidatus Andersenbacteria bacterium]|nr:hypothetical protein [Candidatus Andersenbacteria bacterium]
MLIKLEELGESPRFRFLQNPPRLIRQLVSAFRLGVRDLFGQRFWERIEERSSSTEPSELASELLANRENVYQYRKGRLSLEFLVCAMTDTNVSFVEVNEPNRLQRFASGLARAVFFHLHGRAYPAKTSEESPNEVDIACLLLLGRSREFLNLRKSKKTPTSEHWHDLAEQLAVQLVDGEFGFESSQVKHLDGEHLRLTCKQWDRAFKDVLAETPYEWLEE